MEGPVEYLEYLDGWRGLAIALVLEDHFVGLMVNSFDAGRLGVDIFFCLSGFLMAGILFLQQQPLTKFYKRRISRILPAFLLFVFFVFAYAWLAGIDFTIVEFISTVFFLRTYLPVEVGIWASAVPIGHLWSLNIEEHSYLFMSAFILLGFFRKREAEGLLISGVGCLAVGVIYAKLGPRAPHSGGIGSEIAASHILIAAGYRLLREKRGIKVPPWAPVLALAAALPFYVKSFAWWGHSLVTPLLLAFAVNHISQTYERLKEWLSHPALRQLGLWSFSIYLWQQPFQHDNITFTGSVVGLSCTMAAALISFYIIEQPARGWLNRYW
ncbi:MAG: acyltransferase [Chloracidobacterium sp.]|nr:acyltransferase [Chloracidobacterium sp.]